MIYGSKNKGDWGEMYTLIYLIGERKLYSADSKLNKDAEMYFPLIKAIRDENIPEPDEKHTTKNHIEFNLSGAKDVEIFLNSQLIRKMDSSEFVSEAKLLYADIIDEKSHTNKLNGSFNIPNREKFINNIGCKRLAAASNDITDITLELHDSVSGCERSMGFSVKSYLGGAPTLLNASTATNFIYKVDGISDDDMDKINKISTRTKIKDRLSMIDSLGGSLSYEKLDNITFHQNLKKLDGDIEGILAESILCFYKDNIKKCTEIVESLEQKDPLGCSIPKIYRYKFKRFLCAKALGLEPAKEWSGEDDANGGYIVAKADGDVLAFHLYDRDVFKNYLLENTFFEKGSTKKHKFASIYADENGKKYIKLNLQIRFND